ncbi:MAG: 1-acyl-sn-glycerol-3-phosphate acyltransferase [Anaerolineales bacterium]|nr:1-acyl-sn-glycerol-3-phosphate acyltransferase [Anaerolineales bacterium]
MDVQPANVETLTRDITWEILGAFNLPRTEYWQDRLGWIFRKPARRFSEIFASFDQDIYHHGLTEASKRLLRHFADSSTAYGFENIPKTGPVLVASNHPGTLDAVSIMANFYRNDVKVVVGGMPFLQSLPVGKHYTIVSSKTNDAVRANVVRSSIHHLQDGGAVLIFPSGQIDPDPAVLPGAKEALEKWSKSIAVMLRRVPETCLISTITSGVLHEKFTHTPLTFIKRDGVGKRRIMEFIQVMRQLLFKEDLGLKPLITFDQPVTLDQLSGGSKADASLILQNIIERAKLLYERHTSLLKNHLNSKE